VVLQGDTQWYYSVNSAAWDANFHNRDNRVNLVFLDGHAALTRIVPHMDITPDYCFPIWQPPDPP
jgi:prepilin-type processing-associated H-X9-DG protein